MKIIEKIEGCNLLCNWSVLLCVCMQNIKLDVVYNEVGRFHGDIMKVGQWLTNKLIWTALNMTQTWPVLFRVMILDLDPIHWSIWLDLQIFFFFYNNSSHHSSLVVSMKSQTELGAVEIWSSRVGSWLSPIQDKYSILSMPRRSTNNK